MSFSPSQMWGTQPGATAASTGTAADNLNRWNRGTGIRADYDDETIVVYQAYPREIAEPAVSAQKFVPPFKTSRMTWIKPSFLWIMYRSGWATKPVQERALRIRMTQSRFEEALGMSCLASFDPGIHDSRESWQQQKAASPVRIQWDPERDLNLQPLPTGVFRSGSAAQPFHVTWITGSFRSKTSPLGCPVYEAVAGLHYRTNAPTPCLRQSRTKSARAIIEVFSLGLTGVR